MSSIIDPPSERQATAGVIVWAAAVAFSGVVLGFLVANLQGASFVLLAPAALLVVVAFWAMAEPRSVPSKWSWYILFITVIITAIWPRYIALRLPGLPWLNFPRVLMTIFLVLWLYCVLNSKTMRRNIEEDFTANKAPFLFLIIWLLMMIASIPLSRDVSESATKVGNFLLMDFGAFLAIASLATTPKRVTLLAVVIPLCALLEMLIGLREAHTHQVVWTHFVPPGFSADERFVAGLLEGATRELANSEEYRVQGHFFVSLSYAEFLALCLPFAVHWVLEAKNLFIRAFFLGIVILSFPAINVSHSRLGMVGFFLVGLTYAGYFAFRTWLRTPKSTIGPVLVLMFPLLLVGFAAALTVSGRLHGMVIGGGETEASDAARALQRQQAYPKIAASPIFGYGVASGGSAVGYASENGHETFDNGILLIALDSGVIALLSFLGLAGWNIIIGAKLYFFGRTKSSKLAGAISVFFIAFLVIRWVLAQQENQQLVMAVAGMLIGLCRIERSAALDETSTHAVAAKSP